MLFVQRNTSRLTLTHTFSHSLIAGVQVSPRPQSIQNPTECTTLTKHHVDEIQSHTTTGKYTRYLVPNEETTKEKDRAPELCC